MFTRLFCDGFYLAGDLTSWLQKALRRASDDQARFCACRLDVSGYGNYVWKRLMVVMLEDHFAAPSLVTTIPPLYQAWRDVVGARTSRSHEVDEARELLMKAVTMIAAAPKSRLANDAGAVSLKYAYEEKCTFEALEWEWKEAIEKKEMHRAVALTRYMLHKHKQPFPFAEINGGAYQKIVSTFPATLQLAAFNAVMHALLPQVRTSEGQWEAEYPAHREVSPHLTDWYNVRGIEARYPLPIPDFVFDNHTERGKGRNTLKRLKSRLKSVGINYHDYPEAFWLRSHGPPITYPEGMTPVAYFFDVSSQLVNEPFPNPFHDTARDFYLMWEEQYGTRQAKSRYMIKKIFGK